MATVTNTIRLPDGSTPTTAAVEIELVASTSGRAAAWVTATDVTLIGIKRPTVTSGAWTASLTPNADITPSGTVYKITEYADRHRYVHYITVTSGGGTVHDLLTDAPASLATAASQVYADAAVAPVEGSVGSYGVSRVLTKLLAGEDIVITGFGDSILEGLTVTNTATDGCLIVLAAELEDRFGVTVTLNNRANSGYTVARSTINGDIATGIADAADLYVIAYGKNDISAESEGGANPVPGYPIDASIAAFERIIREIRTDVPHADIIVMAENPYVPGSSSNTYLLNYIARQKELAWVYGCQFVDCYTPFLSLGGGDWTAWMNDSTHPNTLGHAVMADTLAAPFRADFVGPVITQALPAAALHDIADVDLTNGNNGYVSYAAPASSNEALTWANTGTWSGSNPYVTTTAGDKASGTFRGTELLAQLSTLDADNLRATVRIDGGAVYTNADFTTGKTGTYWVPLAVGLDADDHTWEIELVSGTLKLFKVGTLSSPLYGSDTRTTVITPNVSTVTLTSSYQTLVTGSVSKPVGWASMDLVVTGWTQFRTLAPTTSIRRITTNMRVAGVAVCSRDLSIPIADPDTLYQQVAYSFISQGVTASSTTLAIDARVSSTGTTNCQSTNWHLSATLVRTG